MMIDSFSECIFVSDGSSSSNAKFRNAYKCMEILDRQYGGSMLDKIKLIYNRFSSRNSEQLDNDTLTVVGGINRIEGAKPKELMEQIMEYTFLDDIM